MQIPWLWWQFVGGVFGCLVWLRGVVWCGSIVRLTGVRLCMLPLLIL